MSEDRPVDENWSQTWDREGSQSLQGRISLDEAHYLLAEDRRRAILSYLLTSVDGPVPVDDVVAALAERESPTPGPATHRDRIEIDLYHVQLPALADAGVVTFHPATETVVYEGSERLEALLAAESPDDQGDDQSSL